jgi:pyridoxal biosynthesis lyase PdxS
MPSSTSKSKSGAKTAAKSPLQKGSQKAGKATAKKADSKKLVKTKTNPKTGSVQKKPKTNNRATTKLKRGKSMSENDKSNGDQKALDQLATDNSLETVRDILFGAQVKQANERDQQLEKLINTRADSLQKSLDAQMKSVENTIAKLTEKLDKEAAQTATKVEQRFKQVEDLIKNTDNKTQASQQEMYDELVAERQALERDAKAWNEDLAKELENVHNQLKESKTDRLTLANLLTDMAASLIADPKTPVKK